MKCENCLWWRDKGWDSEGGGIGICDNPKTIEQVRMMNKETIARFFAAGKDDVERESNAFAVHNSLRFQNDFGCVNFEKAEWK